MSQSYKDSEQHLEPTVAFAESVASTNDNDEAVQALLSNSDNFPPLPSTSATVDDWELVLEQAHPDDWEHIQDPSISSFAEAAEQAGVEHDPVPRSKFVTYSMPPKKPRRKQASKEEAAGDHEDGEYDGGAGFDEFSVSKIATAQKRRSGHFANQRRQRSAKVQLEQSCRQMVRDSSADEQEQDEEARKHKQQMQMRSALQSIPKRLYQTRMSRKQMAMQLLEQTTWELNLE